MWILFAAGSALFAGVTAILAKCGIRKTDSTVATAIRTLVVLVFAWTMVFVVGSQGEIRNIGPTTLLFLVLSGLATGASWLCYFKALQLGDINKVVPIDKSSTVLTILLAFFLLGEPIGLPQGIGVVLIGTGTFLMLEKRSPAAGCAPQCGSWMLYAFGSAVFASLTAILGKAGIQGVESNLGTAIRTGVVLVMAWLMVLVTGKAGAVRQVPRRVGFHLPVRRGHRGLLAVLLPGASERPRQRGGAHRQVEHFGHSGLFPAGVSGEAHISLRRRSCPHCGRDAGHAVLTAGAIPLQRGSLRAHPMPDRCSFRRAASWRPGENFHSCFFLYSVLYWPRFKECGERGSSLAPRSHR